MLYPCFFQLRTNPQRGIRNTFVEKNTDTTCIQGSTPKSLAPFHVPGVRMGVYRIGAFWFTPGWQMEDLAETLIWVLVKSKLLDGKPGFDSSNKHQVGTH